MRIGDTIALNSAVLEGEVVCWVRLPGEYQKTDFRYPVIYLMNGHMISTFAGAVATREHLEDTLTPSFVLVGIQNIKVSCGPEKDEKESPPVRLDVDVDNRFAVGGVAFEDK